VTDKVGPDKPGPASDQQSHCQEATGRVRASPSQARQIRPAT
jgi:hypothetical protein